jgi:CubicO group peptidase (beta-lactamase class C family)
MTEGGMENRVRARRGLSIWIATFAAAALAGAASAAALQCELPLLPGQPFTVGWPGSLDLDAAALKEAVDYASAHNSYSVRVYRHNCLAAKSTLDQLTENVPNNVWSTTKGVISMLVGRAEKLGKLSLDDPIGKYLPQFPVDPAHGAITIRQLLTQSSGLHFVWTPELAQVPDDEVQYTLDLPFDYPRGTHFEYGQTTITLLARVVQEAVGQDLQDFAHEQLFAPIGIERNWIWMRDRAGNTRGWADLYLAPVDLARLGHVMLRQGRWRDVQLLRSGYVKSASTPSAPNPYYGFLYWLNASDHGYTVAFPGARAIENRRMFESAPPDLYAFVGFRDQLIFVIPSLDMVVVRTGEPGNTQGNEQQLLTADSGEWHHEFFRKLMKSVKDVRYTDPGPYDWQDGSGLVIDIDHFLWVPPLP